jgi:flagellin-like protein
MQLTQLFTDDDAVSPVIGVILMVAITVILAAVIATFVLGLGEQLSDSAPSATFDFDYDEDNTELTITHTGGDTIKASDLYVRGIASPGDWTTVGSYDADSDIGAGASVAPTVNAGDTVRVVWESDQGDQSSTLQQWDGPDA